MSKFRSVRSATFVAAVALLTVAAIGCGANDSKNSDAHARTDGTAEVAHWSYEGADGPANWGSLDPSFTACADGSAQTPIDIVNPIATDLPDPVFTYSPGTGEITNNGHTIQVNAAPGNSMMVNGKTYQFLQAHFHAPSEHTIAGKSYPAEVHFVHKADDGSLAVVGVMLTVGGADNPAWSSFVKGLPTQVGETKTATFDWLSMYPADHQTIRYDGSLTTPPCSEGVSWLVMSTPVEISDAQLKDFEAAYNGNNRPIEPLNGRSIQIDSTKK